MTDIPDWIDDKITFDNSKEIQDRHIVEVFLDSDRPYLSIRTVAAEIDLTKEGTQPRLEELEEIGVLDGDTIAGGRIFWIRDDRSDWPIPPDVEVTPSSDAVTVEEFLSKLYVQYGLVGVVLTMIGGLSMVAFTLVSAYQIPIPVIDTADILLGGVALIFIGYSVGVVGIGYALWDRFANST